MRDQLIKRFKPVLSPTSLKLFTKLLDGAESIDDDGVHFEQGVWQLLPGAKKVGKRVPAAHAKLLAVCGGMIWGEVGDTGQVVLTDGFRGTLHALGEDGMGESFDFPYSKSLFSPIDIDSGDFYLLHPDTGKLLFQTEGVVDVVKKTVDVVEIYLREMLFEVLDGPHREGWLETT